MASRSGCQKATGGPRGGRGATVPFPGSSGRTPVIAVSNSSASVGSGAGGGGGGGSTRRATGGFAGARPRSLERASLNGLFATDGL